MSHRITRIYHHIEPFRIK